MISDEERREVAEKLRASIPGDGVMRRGDKGWSLLYRTIFGHYMGNQSAGRTYSEVAGRLADLIEPNCDTAATHTDATATRDVSQGRRSDVDRDALLALADDIDKQTDGSMFDARLEDGHYIARRIREAVGS